MSRATLNHKRTSWRRPYRPRKSLWKCQGCGNVYDRWRGDVPQENRQCVNCQKGGE